MIQSYLFIVYYFFFGLSIWGSIQKVIAHMCVSGYFPIFVVIVLQSLIFCLSLFIDL